MTGGEGHETLCLDVVSSALEGSDAEVVAPCLLTHRYQFRTLMTSPPRNLDFYTSMTGGEGHETPCLDVVSSGLEGTDVEAAVVR
jgi:hypothetical protein